MKETKGIVSLILASALILGSLIMPVPEGLTTQGVRGICLLVAVIVLYITEALPLIVTTLTSLALMPLLEIVSLSEAWSAFGNSAIFFMLASFGISAGLINTHIPHAVTCFILEWSRGKARKLCYGFMVGSAAISAVMSDVPTCVIFGALVLQLLKAAGLDKPGETSLGRALMVSVPVGSIVGGFATPAGNSLNIMVIGAAEIIGGTSISFAQWCIVGIPVAVIMVVLCGFWVNRCFLPEDIDEAIVHKMRNDLHEHAKFSLIDIKYAVVLTGMIVLLIASSWDNAINVTIVSIMGVAIMHLPGIRILKGKDFVNGVSWESFIMCGGIIALGTGVQGTGAIAWLVQIILSNAHMWPAILVFFVFSLIGCLVHLATPAAGAIYTLTCTPLLTAAVVLGLNPMPVAFIVATWICISFMQPLDLVYMLTYGYNYYTMPELVRFGIVPTVALLVISITLIPAICMII